MRVSLRTTLRGDLGGVRTPENTPVPLRGKLSPVEDKDDWASRPEQVGVQLGLSPLIQGWDWWWEGSCACTLHQYASGEPTVFSLFEEGLYDGFDNLGGGGCEAFAHHDGRQPSRQRPVDALASQSSMPSLESRFALLRVLTCERRLTSACGGNTVTPAPTERDPARRTRCEMSSI